MNELYNLLLFTIILTLAGMVNGTKDFSQTVNQTENMVQTTNQADNSIMTNDQTDNSRISTATSSSATTQNTPMNAIQKENAKVFGNVSSRAQGSNIEKDSSNKVFNKFKKDDATSESAKVEKAAQSIVSSDTQSQQSMDTPKKNFIEHPSQDDLKFKPAKIINNYSDSGQTDNTKSQW